MADRSLETGDIAPDFDLAGADGRRHRLADYRGRKLVLYFYPRDSTPGCTREAQDFTALGRHFEAADTDILGVSKDSADSHGRFVAKYDLGVALGSDAGGGVAEAYGVWGEKQLYGRAFMGIERSTFLIGRDGRLAAIWRKVRVPGHAEAVLEEARRLD